MLFLSVESVSGALVVVCLITNTSILRCVETNGEYKNMCYYFKSLTVVIKTILIDTDDSIYY